MEYPVVFSEGNVTLTEVDYNRLLCQIENLELNKGAQDLEISSLKTTVVDQKALIDRAVTELTVSLNKQITLVRHIQRARKQRDTCRRKLDIIEGYIQKELTSLVSGCAKSSIKCPNSGDTEEEN